MFNSKAEFASALIEGRKFKYRNHIMYVDKTLDQVPFRVFSDHVIFSVPMVEEWGLYDKVEEIIEPKWYENIPEHGVLCWVWDENIENSKIARIEKRRSNNTFQFVSDVGAAWINAEPMTKEEVMKYILEEQCDGRER